MSDQTPQTAAELRDEMRAELRRLRSENERLRSALANSAHTMEQMVYFAYTEGLEGDRAWDNIAGRADLHGVIDAARSALKKDET